MCIYTCMSPIKSQLLNSSNKYLVNYFLGTIYVFKPIGILTYQLDQQGVVSQLRHIYGDLMSVHLHTLKNENAR